MKVLINASGYLLTICLIILIMSNFASCSSEDSAETQTTAKKTTTLGRTVQKTKDVVASLANPEEGLDPVCGMAVDGSLIVSVDGKDYGFCSQNCADKFKENPEKYLDTGGNND